MHSSKLVGDTTQGERAEVGTWGTSVFDAHTGGALVTDHPITVRLTSTPRRRRGGVTVRERIVGDSAREVGTTRWN